MDLQNLTQYIVERPYTIRMGAGSLAKRTHSTEESVRAAKTLAKEQLSKQKAPKILIFDIETSPMKAYVWRMWKQSVNLDHVIHDWYVICWSAKWLYANEVLGDVLTPEEACQEDDKRVVTSLWKLFNEADIVVAHNGNKFDIPKMNARFIQQGLPPTTPYYSIDTCAIARKQFGFSSNKLDALAEYFGFAHKLDTEFELWKKCMEGDQKSLDYMLKYNKRDVTLLEEVYLRLRPWIKGHPNCANYIDSKVPICSNCGSKNLTKLEGQYYYTSVGKYQLYRCQCGTVSRGRINLNDSPVKTTSVLK